VLQDQADEQTFATNRVAAVSRTSSATPATESRPLSTLKTLHASHPGCMMVFSSLQVISPHLAVEVDALGLESVEVCVLVDMLFDNFRNSC
jgi:hypothetical protein